MTGAPRSPRSDGGDTAARLILMRHAEAERGRIGGSDHDRALTAAGRAAAARMGRTLAAADLVPDLALVSTAMRTRQTWAAAAEAFAGVETRFERRIYEASTAALSALAAETLEGAASDGRTVIIVGHNPGLHLLAATLAGHGARRIHSFPTAAAAAFRLAADDGLRGAELERFLTLPDIDT